MLEEFPNHWIEARLGDIVHKLVDGSHTPPPKQSSGLPMLSAVNICGNTIDFTENYRLIDSAAFAEEDRRTAIVPGDVLLTIVGAIGRTAVVPAHAEKFTLQRSVAVLGPVLAESKFLMYQFEAPRFATYLKDNARGTAQKGVYLKTLAKAPLCLAPLREQRRIVAKIEELFSELDKGIEALTTAREQLKAYRQSVLKHAFDGKLTEGWRWENLSKLETADQIRTRLQHDSDNRYRQILEAWNKGDKAARPAKPRAPAPIASAVEQSVEPFPLPKGWSWVPLSWLLSTTKKPMTTGPFGTMLKKQEHRTTGVPVLGIENIGKAAFIHGNKIFVSEGKAKELSAFAVEASDVVISRSGTVGEICEVPAGLGTALISTNLIRVSLNPAVIIPAFFVYMFQGGGSVRTQVKDLCKGSSRDFLNQSILESIKFPLCGLDEQKEILERLSEHMSHIEVLTESIESNYGARTPFANPS
jgi:type I restriction enzyme S subunit